MPETSLADDHKPIFVARQPIYDAQEQVWAYELLFRSSAYANTSAVTEQEHDMATAAIIADGFSLAFNGMDKTKKAFINFPQRLLLNDSVYALPNEICVVEVLETVKPTEEVLNMLRSIKGRGYTIALDNYTGQDACSELVELADIVKVNMLGTGIDRLPAIAQGLLSKGCQLLAEKVEDRPTYALAKELGFTLFQGYLFSRPETVAGSKTPSLVSAKMRLLHALISEDYDIGMTTSILSTDPSLCYRLLKYLNSACFSLCTKIQSIQQAIILLGRQKLRQWLLAVMVADFDCTPKVQEAAYASLQRARYMESMARLYNNVVYPPETLFLLGLFSKLDILLGQPMPSLMENFPLTAGVVEALLSIPSPYLDWLTFVERIERGKWDEVDVFLKTYGFDHETSSRLYAESMSWTQDILKNNTDN